jgi:putative transposase
MIQAVTELTTTREPALRIAPACRAVGLARSRWYRTRQAPALAEAPAPTEKRTPANAAARALSASEKAQVREVLNRPRFADQAPREVYATLLDEGQYLCSWRQMYRVLAENDAVRERRDQLRHPAYTRPELVATAPNRAWSWDITKLLGPTTWVYYYLYVVLDLYSRYIVGWLLAEEESAELAQALVTQSCAKQGITPGQLVLHADRGTAMVSKSLGQLLTDLGVRASHARPHTPDDNPFSEAQFKTMKYRPDFPVRFDGYDHALSWTRIFVPWYNDEHHHTGLALLTPADVHCGRAAQVIARRQAVLQQAYTRHPARFVKGVPVHPALPEAVWINPPKPAPALDTDTTTIH